MTGGFSEKRKKGKKRHPKQHVGRFQPGDPVVEDTFFRMQRRIDNGEETHAPFREVPLDHGGGAYKETGWTRHLDEKYERVGFVSPNTPGTQTIMSDKSIMHVEPEEREHHPKAEILFVLEEPSNLPAEVMEAARPKGRAQFGFCPDCGYYLSLKNSCCPSGSMLVCLECAYTRTYEGR